MSVRTPELRRGHKEFPEQHELTATAPAPANADALAEFVQVYDMYANFVWCTLRKLGVSDSSADDALQDVFVVVHRRLADYDRTRPIKTWLYGITVRVVRDYRRRIRRKGGLEPLSDFVPDTGGSPQEAAVKSEGLRIVHQLVGRLDEDKREVFLLAELEQLTVPEIAEILGINPRTIYSRLRAARDEFEAAAARHVRRQQ